MTVGPDITTMVDDLTRLVTMIARASLRDHRTADFASLLTRSLAAAAANVGGPDALLAGRPGSWEASYIRDLLRGAMGDSPEQWWSLMTEPVVVCLNVAELIEDSDLHPGLVGLDEAEDNLDGSFDDDSDQDQLSSEHAAAIDNLRRRYADSCARYAEEFTVAVESVAVDLGLPLPPQLLVDEDPNSAWWEDSAVRNSIESDSALATELWERAHAIVPLPDVDIRADQPEPTKGS